MGVLSTASWVYAKTSLVIFFMGGFTGEFIIFFLFIFSNTSTNDTYYFSEVFLKKAFLINTTKSAINNWLK